MFCTTANINISANNNATPSRILSLDSFRGWAIFSMIMVNYLGMFDAVHWQFKHHDYGMSFADTVAPAFIFAVGMGLRNSFERRRRMSTFGAACLHTLRRYIALIIIGIIIYGPYLENWPWWWDALVDIGFAGILSLPFIGQGKTVRAAAAAAYLIAYQAAFLATGYGAWTMEHSIDGGPLGIFPWAAILLFGTIAFDILAAPGNRKVVLQYLVWGLLLCAVGWLLKMPWPGIKAEWPFSQRAMSIPYPLFSSGLCFLMYLPLYLMVDKKGWTIPHLPILGMNALVIYLTQQLLLEVHGVIVVSRNAGLWGAIFSYILFYLVCYAVARKLHKEKIYIKV